MGSVSVPQFVFYNSGGFLWAGPAGNLTVHRPPGVGGPIAVSVSAVQQVFNGFSWVQFRAPVQQGVIGAGQNSVTFGNLNLQSCCPTVVKNHWRGIYAVAWGGIGQTFVVPSNAAAFPNACILRDCADFGTYVFVNSLF